MNVQLHLGDCLEVLRGLPDGCVDAVVTDPPYGLSFMGKNWDHGVPGVHFWEAQLRVAKPGAHLLAFGGTRTHHRLMVAIEDAGWEIRDCLMWLYGTGFPKSHNLGNGWGTALKPAWEPIILARKPLQGTVAANVQIWGTGAINVDGCRVGIDSTLRSQNDGPSWSGKFGGGQRINGSNNGRWPANLLLDEETAARVDEMSGTSKSPSTVTSGAKSSFQATGRGQAVIDCYNDRGGASRFFYCAKANKRDRDEGLDGMELRDSSVGDNCPSGSFSQRVHRDRNVPDTVRRNHHPTVKPTDLMRYLCRLVTPAGGIVLDPFMGSGSTGKAAMLEGFRFVGIEKEAEYLEIAQRRIAEAQMQPLLFATEPTQKDIA